MNSNHAIPHPVQSAALAHPEAPAVGDWTWASLRDGVARRARRFQPGELVGLDGPQDAAWIAWAYAIGWAGAVLAPLPADPAARAVALNTLAPDQIVRSDAPIPDGAPLPERFWPLDETRILLTSSGTTGTPKRIALTTAQILFSAMGSALRLGHLPGDRWLNCLPLHHVGGLAILFRAAWSAAAIERCAFDPPAVAARLDSGAIQLASFTPAMLTAVLDARPARSFPPTLRALLIGGAATPDALKQRCASLNVPIRTTWGMSEAGSQVCTDGAPLAFTRVAAQADETLVITGPCVPDGRLVTADRGRVHANGQVEVLGRRDDLIISGGVNLDPGAIEAAIRSVPGVQDAVVVPRPHPRWGQRPVAVYVGDPVPLETLQAACRAQVHRFAAPDAAWRWPALPAVGPLGKRSRSAVRRQLDADAAQSRIEGGRAREGAEVAQPPEGVLEADGAMRPQHELEGDRPRGAAGHPGLDVDGHRLTHGLAIVGLDVHQRHDQIHGLEGLGAPQRGVEQLLEAGVGVLEGPRKEDDAGAIHLVEARRDGVAKAHELLKSKGSQR